ncbi:hypothetical protein RUND412_000266 [Rhizina undulata]
MEHPILPLHEPAATMSLTYTPSRLDDAAGTTPLTFRDSPFKLVASDLKLVWNLLHLLPILFSPMHSNNPYAELHPSYGNIKEIILHVILVFLGVIFIFISIPAFIAVPVSVFVVYLAVYFGVVWLFCLPLNMGKRTVQSKVDLGDIVERDDERWVFINGVCAGKYWIQANVDMLSSIFKRKVFGVHNLSYGTVFDLLECLIQRCFSYSTNDTRTMYEYLKKTLMDESINKVVVIAHSQGGIILSTALDTLFADLPSTAFTKLEIYTFGCAANHFNNPIRGPLARTRRNIPAIDTAPPYERHIRYIEHYCNENDFVARFGALHFAKDKVSNRFVGRMFEWKGKTGHLMNQHYLDPMFGSDNSEFLSQVVDVEEAIALAREETVATQALCTQVHGEHLQGVNGSSLAAEANGGASADAGPGGANYINGLRTSIQQQRGKTVRDLSRLWQYRNGGNPMD